MKPYIDLQGASGAVYRYKLAEDRDPRTTIAGNFVFVDATGTIVYAGEDQQSARGRQPLPRGLDEAQGREYPAPA